MTKSPPSVRGRAAVEAALVRAAGELLAEVGYRAMSVRDVAARAGVNHGQVHHSFGSKETLVRAAMRALATEHFDHAQRQAGHDGVPPALSLASDERYWKAVIMLAVEGELDIVRAEVDHGVSVPRHALEVLGRRRGQDTPDLDTKTAVAAAAVLQLGWVALERFAFLVVDASPEEEPLLRARIRRIATALFEGEVTGSGSTAP